MTMSGEDSALETIVSIEFEFSGTPQPGMHINGSADPRWNGLDGNNDGNETTFAYTGKHDHGQLPTMKNSDSGTAVVNALLKAKVQCDEYLTTCINLNQKEQSTGNPEKKPRIEEES